VSDGLQDLFAAIREACDKSTWSRGVGLARSGAVSGERDEGTEVVLRISTRGGLVSPTATLYLDDEEWDCDCGTVEDVCEHVAGAVIALKRARAEGDALPKGDTSAGRIGYRLTRADGTLHFSRVVVGDTETTLAATLAAVSSGRADGPSFVATQEHLRVERVLGSARSGRLPRGLWQKLVPALEGCRDITLDGEPIQSSGERVGYVAVLEDQENGFFLRVKRDPRVHETFTDEVALLADDTLCLLGASGLTGREKDAYERGQSFAPERVAELVTEILPSLGERIPVDIKTQRLPSTESEPPRIAIEARRSGESLEVFPTLVYGDPPRARVDAGKLVPLGGALPLRDEAAERNLTRRIQQELELAPGRRLKVTGEDAVRLAERIEKLGFEVTGGELEGFHRTAPLTARLELDPDAFAIHFESEGEPGSPRAADPERVLRAWRQGESLVPLLDGGFAPLPADWLARYGTVIADLLAARDEKGAIARAALPDLAGLCESLDEPVPLDAAAIQKLADTAERPAAAALPPDLTADLRDYQREGADWLVQRRECGIGALLADDMGLGKTLQLLCAVEAPALVVAPTSVLHNWAAEIRKFRPGLSFHTYHGANRKLDPSVDVTLTSYAILRLDVEALAAISWGTVVLDESQAIKNPQSQAAQAAFRLDAKFRVALTGTPVENRLEELWSQLHFLNPGLLGGRRDFDERYGRPIAAKEDDAAVRLRARIAPFIRRRTKKQVAPELPPRTDVVLHAELSPDERAIYDALLAATRDDVIARLSEGGSTFQALEALLRLRQAACHPALVPGQTAETSSKVELLLEQLEEAVDEGHKALVFSQWTSLLDRVEPHLRRAEIDFSRLDGSTRNRGAVVDGFQSEDGPPVLLLSLKAGGTGLNLTAADNVFILDPWWNPAVEDQAADRAHRIGQDQPVLVQRLVAKNTVEERILVLQERKRALFEAAVGTGAGASAISREEILDLLSP
jgi:superfamily II DNA or RNA helicase